MRRLSENLQSGELITEKPKSSNLMDKLRAFSRTAIMAVVPLLSSCGPGSLEQKASTTDQTTEHKEVVKVDQEITLGLGGDKKTMMLVGQFPSQILIEATEVYTNEAEELIPGEKHYFSSIQGKFNFNKVSENCIEGFTIKAFKDEGMTEEIKLTLDKKEVAVDESDSLLYGKDYAYSSDYTQKLHAKK